MPVCRVCGSDGEGPEWLGLAVKLPAWASEAAAVGEAIRVVWLCPDCTEAADSWTVGDLMADGWYPVIPEPEDAQEWVPESWLGRAWRAWTEGIRKGAGK